MNNLTQQKQKILIADDAEMNRELLVSILEDEYEIIQVKDGVQAVDCLQKHVEEISLLLLDLVMPQMDGFEVLVYMNKEHWIDNVPVIIISSEDSPAYIKRGYDLGVTDFIGKPFDVHMVRRRVTNAILLNAKQTRMRSIVSNQIYESEKSSKLMINILSHIVEFRNGESGLHVLHIQVITDMLLRHLVEMKENPYTISQEEISIISTASALHDIGKITIPDEILNKPGRLTAEEFTIMKGHSMAGANMLEQLPIDQKDDPLVKTAYEICRWHHERYDGGGYPDGLKGEEIPISAQAVALADVYDALTSERCYKDAYSHDKAIEMILAGQCGVFNTLLLECLVEISPQLKKVMYVKSGIPCDSSSMLNMANRFHDYEMESSEKIVQMLEYERARFQFLAGKSSNIVFTYTVSPPLLNLNEIGVKRSGMMDPVLSPLEKGTIQNLVEENSLNCLLKKIRNATKENPVVVSDIQTKDGKKPERYRCDCKVIWASDEKKEYTGVVGMLTDADADYEIVSAVSDAGRLHCRSSEFSRFYDRLKVSGFGISGEEAWILLQYLHITYDLVRYVDPIRKKIIHVERGGRVWESTYNCFEVWNRNEGCENCISAKCLRKKERLMKFEVVQEDIYQVTAMYVEIDGSPCCMELVNKLDDTFIPQGYSRDEVLESIHLHKKKYYIDQGTGIYNRHYYTEQLCRRKSVSAVALADIRDFKKINESFGHQTGDDVLRYIGQALREIVEDAGEVVRYAGDDFVIVFFDTDRDSTEEVLEQIRRKIHEMNLAELAGVKLEMDISVRFGPGKVQELFNEIIK